MKSSGPFFHHFEEKGVHSRVVRKLGVECGCEHVTLADSNGSAVFKRCENVDVLSNTVEDGGAYEDSPIRGAVHAFYFQVHLEAVNLASERVPADAGIHQAQTARAGGR